MTSNGLYKNEPRPRLCHLRRWPDFTGYGFNLHSEKSKPGQYIGKVDPNSPAESAGIRENDRIVEVNFVPIGNENHKQVVTRIKDGVTRNGVKHPDEVILLVLDHDADEYYRSQSIVVRSSDSNVIKLESAIREGSEKGSNSPQSSQRSLGQTDSHHARESSPHTKSNNYQHDTYYSAPPITQTRNSNSPAISRSSDQGYDPPEDRHSYHQPSPPVSEKTQRKEIPPSNNNSSPRLPTHDVYPKPTATASSQLPPTTNQSGALNMQMTAAELREQLKLQKARRLDTRQTQNLSSKQKHDIINNM